MYLCPLPLESLSHFPPIPTPLGYYRAPVWVPWVIQQFPAGSLFTYVIVHASMLLSHSSHLSLSSSPLVHGLFSMSPLLLCEQAHQYHPSRFHIYAFLMWYLFFSFWLTSLCIIGSRFIYLIRIESNAFLVMAAAVAAKPLQSCPTLCDPMDGSLQGSSVPVL